MADHDYRRRSDAEIERIHEIVAGQSRELASIREDFIAHRSECRSRDEAIQRFIDKTFPSHAAAEERRAAALDRAFPIGDHGAPDFDGHRKAHLAMIQAEKAREQFYSDLRKEIGKKGVLGVIVILLGLLWLGIQAKFKSILGP